MNLPTQQKALIGKLISLSIILGAVIFAAYIWRHKEHFPVSEEASIDAEVTHVAAAVGGRIVKIAVRENQLVKAGDILFQLDPVPFQLAVEQARADLALAEATLATKQRALAVQQSNANIASKQIKRSSTNLNLASSTVERLRPLAAKGFVPQQQLDQAIAMERDAEISMQQAREQEAAARQAIDTVDSSLAAVSARQAALNMALRALEDSTVKAVTAGRVVGLAVAPGETLAPFQSLFTLVNTEEWFAMANFKESELSHIKAGDCVTVYSMIDKKIPIKGQVESIGWGVKDTAHIALPRSVPYVERSLNWVKVAQRFPVRIHLHHPPEHLARMGASALVELNRGAACQ
ncbi:multidrug transporter subunit MdtN [Undibacterium rugosum]|uniref:multidrug transporter subunit MdtN n=1 Tax=Undibacterium rugosum TaxID=2762291 RepID=UPI001B8431AA|nr:multidrug transporter subunit MdtN [Undibacterium rugosum]MBR7777579.1 multidrug transporter subunit MdtN [Undibacterium rugosum]